MAPLSVPEIVEIRKYCSAKTVPADITTILLGQAKNSAVVSVLASADEMRRLISDAEPLVSVHIVDRLQSDSPMQFASKRIAHTRRLARHLVEQQKAEKSNEQEVREVTNVLASACMQLWEVMLMRHPGALDGKTVSWITTPNQADLSNYTKLVAQNAVIRGIIVDLFKADPRPVFLEDIVRVAPHLLSGHFSEYAARIGAVQTSSEFRCKLDGLIADRSALVAKFDSAKRTYGDVGEQIKQELSAYADAHLALLDETRKMGSERIVAAMAGTTSGVVISHPSWVDGIDERLAHAEIKLQKYYLNVSSRDRNCYSSR